MADKSWGGDPSATFRIRSNDTLAERSAARAQAREARAAERGDALAERLKARTAARESAVAAREDVRVARRASEMQAASGDPHAAAARRRRSSGRKDVVRDQRDTRGYATILDAGRMRELARRGASIAGLAGAFGITPEDVERVLAEPEAIDPTAADPA